MAKRTAKKSTEPLPGAPTESFQIPEVSPAPPDPWETVAASVPKLPPNNDVTAHTAPATKIKPTLPSGTYDFDPDEVPRGQANLLPPSFSLTRPAMSRFNILGTELLGTCAMANKLGTLQPVKIYVTFSEDRRWLFLMPVDGEATKGLKVDYQKKVAKINLWKPLQRSVDKGYSETYGLDMTEVPITVHGIKGFALYVDLANPDKQAVQEREETAPAADSTGKARPTKQANATPSDRAPKTAPPSSPTASTDPAEEIRRLNKSIDERDDLLDERDSEIDELQKRLKAYEEKYGRLE